MITFKKFLEGTGDAKFDKHMDAMKDKAKDGIAFATKIRSVAQEIPGMFAKQRELEKWMHDELERIYLMPNKALQRYMGELKEISKEYMPTTSVLDMLYFHMNDHEPGTKNQNRGDHNDRLAEIADAFIERHKEDIKDTIISQMAEYKKLAQEAKKHEWPAPWERYTKYSYAIHHAERQKEAFAHLFK